MVLAASLATLALSAGGVMFLGSDLGPRLADLLTVTGVLSAFVAICATEARFSS